MDVDAFVAAHAAEWRRLDELSRRARRPASLSGPELDELVELYQRVATHLSIVRTRSPDPVLIDRLTALVTQGRAAVAGARTSGWQEVSKFLTITFPAAVYARRWWIVGTAAAFCAVAVALGVWVASTPSAQSLTTPTQVRELCGAQFAQYYTSSPAGSFAAQVWTNNALVAAGCITFGALLGLPTLYLLLNNAVNVGVTGGFMSTCGKSDQFFTLILPHGMLELTAVFIAGAVGLRLGWRVLVPGPRRRTEALAAEGRSAVVIALGLVLVLAVSGAVEAFVTPSTLPPAARLTIGAVIEVAFIVYIVVLGRRAAAAGGDVGDIDRELSGDLVPVSA